MLLKHATLDGIAAGEVSMAFRRWRRPTVKEGGTLVTRIGVLGIDRVREVSERGLTTAQAKKAGYASLADLKQELARRPEGQLYRIEFHLEGEDPRIALRQKTDWGAAELEELRTRLERWDRASTDGPWTRPYLELIARHPGRRAPELADEMGRETAPFKARVRKLKGLGLTESLKVGYRLSPRGEAALGLLRKVPPR